jgi:hypothetical protein
MIAMVDVFDAMANAIWTSMSENRALRTNDLIGGICVFSRYSALSEGK